MLYEHFCSGINLGGWLSQYEFLARQPLNAENLDRHFSTFITRKELADIRGMGFDHVRLPVSGYFLFDRESRTLSPVALR